MKKLGLLIALTMLVSVSSQAAFSQASAPANEGKFKKAIMWGPRKIGAGFKKMGGMFHKK